jgi:hypothetical protein
VSRSANWFSFGEPHVSIGSAQHADDGNASTGRSINEVLLIGISGEDPQGEERF